jgi:hypothetical protein
VGSKRPRSPVGVPGRRLHEIVVTHRQSNDCYTRPVARNGDAGRAGGNRCLEPHDGSAGSNCSYADCLRLRQLGVRPFHCLTRRGGSAPPWDQSFSPWQSSISCHTRAPDGALRSSTREEAMNCSHTVHPCNPSRRGDSSRKAAFVGNTGTPARIPPSRKSCDADNPTASLIRSGDVPRHSATGTQDAFVHGNDVVRIGNVWQVHDFSYTTIAILRHIAECH